MKQLWFRLVIWLARNEIRYLENRCYQTEKEYECLLIKLDETIAERDGYKASWGRVIELKLEMLKGQP
jgi:hypothetical protein